MSELIPDKKFISKLNSGFPAYLDWEKLRAEGMDYIGKLSGKIWTDHNVHDPGITILEILCYALMDLGYRTNLPSADIFTRNPEDKSKENNFFTASEILTCNPLTITDFRKMLVDIEGVRNAWLEDHYYPYITSKTKGCPAEYNGLYHVYIEPETDDATDSNPFIIDLKKTVRQKLMQHRNLCEDFIDIRILCKTKIGLCADIEIEKDADAAEVYRLAVEKLQSFFSPSPKFYTLRQLLEEKNKSIEEIFAGRPYNMKESHGFVDTEEFENLKLRKELHLSDVYSELLTVPGIRTVTNLAWRSDCISGSLSHNSNWYFKIPENNTVVFAPECSVFQFIRNGVRVSFDTEEFAE